MDEIKALKKSLSNAVVDSLIWEMWSVQIMVVMWKQFVIEVNAVLSVLHRFF